MFVEKCRDGCQLNSVFMLHLEIHYRGLNLGKICSDSVTKNQSSLLLLQCQELPVPQRHSSLN